MCFGGRAKDEAGASRSREIDKTIRADEKKMSKEVKLLLLGMSCPRHISIRLRKRSDSS
jgi:hypothetical protein